MVVEKYLWQGLTRLLAVYDGSDTMIMRFEYADSRVPLAVVREGVRYYLTCDQIGSLRLVADTSGNPVKEINYDSFGNLLNDTNPAFSIPLGFAGGLHDVDTGLVRFGYRDYDPETGRWTAKDPIGFAGGDTDLYGYCLNDPVNFVDPWGLQGSQWNVFNSINNLHNGYKMPEVDIPSLGDMISEDNGNLFPGFRDQDGRCSLPGPLGDMADDCVLERCQGHDDCYEENDCNASSWIPSILGGTKPCNDCNSGFFK